MKNQHYQQLARTNVLVFLLFFVINCQTPIQIDLQGHRGARGLYPENSIPAFEKAINLGVTTLELDIAITKDNNVVVSHEPYMSHTICLKPNGKEITETEEKSYNLYQMTHKDIKRFDCGSKYNPNYSEQKKVSVYKPLLKEVFDLVASKQSNVCFNIEIKSKPEYYGIYTPLPKPYVALVLEQIKTSGFFHRTTLQSFDINILEEIKKQSPTMPVALLVDDNETIFNKLQMLSYKPEIVSPYYKLIDIQTVNRLKSEGFKIIPWTVNTIPEMQNLIDMGVDGIITDYPNYLIK